MLKTLSETRHRLMSQVERFISLIDTIPGTSATPERTYLRSTMSQNRLTHILILNLSQSTLYEIPINEILKEFVCRTADRKCVFGKI